MRVLSLLRKPVGPSILKQHFHYFHSEATLPFYFHSINILFPFRGWCFHSEEYFHSTRAAHALGVDVSLHVVGSTYEIQKQTWVRERKIALSKKYSYVW